MGLPRPMSSFSCKGDLNQSQSLNIVYWKDPVWNKFQLSRKTWTLNILEMLIFGVDLEKNYPWRKTIDWGRGQSVLCETCYFDVRGGEFPHWWPPKSSIKGFQGFSLFQNTPGFSHDHHHHTIVPPTWCRNYKTASAFSPFFSIF